MPWSSARSLSSALPGGDGPGPPRLILVGAVLGWPVGFLAVRATGESGLLTYAFPVACSMLLTTLISPLYHRRRGIDATTSGNVRG